MMKMRSNLYLIFLFIFSLFFSIQDLSKETLIDIKFLIPQRVFYYFIMILFIFMENIYIVEKIRNLIEIKEYIIIRIKKNNYKKLMVKSLLKILMSYLVINVIWCYCLMGIIPLFMLILDMIFKVIMICLVSKIYKNDNIYMILFVYILICRFIANSII